MGADTRIEWADHTFNPWVGCTKVSPACDHCYAEGWAKRTGNAALWQGARRRTSAANWQQPHRWNRAAQAAGTRARVFCASLADVFDNQVPEEWRTDLWRLISDTPHLDWLLLTKRPQNIGRMLPASWAMPPVAQPNLWLGTTVENQAEADRRILHLLRVPAAVRFLSCEPLLGPVDLTAIRWPCPTEHYVDVLRGGYWNMAPYRFGAPAAKPGAARGGFTNHSDMPGRPNMIGWVIAGGESGPGARPAHPDWFRSLRDQCAAADVPYFLKQWGDHHPHGEKMADHSVNCLGNPDDDRWSSVAGATFWRLGKARAGALLDGREHREFPHA
jgi:protein gp37